jgi:SMC interacting uncharacterized protein involved in chromosome segregation
VALLERLFFGIKRMIELDSKVEKLGHATAELNQHLRELELRLIRVETALELASDGRFRPRLLGGRDSSDG